MAVTSPPAFHHSDDGTLEHAWHTSTQPGARAWLNLVGVEHLVVVVAHPDDETLMAGGLMALAHMSGIRIDVVVATDGEASHPHSPTHSRSDLVGVRRLEVTSAVTQLAPSATLHMMGLADGNLAAYLDNLVCTLVNLIAMHGPETLLVSTWRGDGHPDHEAAARAAASAAWRTDARFLEAPIWFWHWGSPATTPVPSGPSLSLPSGVLRKKRAAMMEHRSQVEPLSEQPGDEAILTPGMLSHFERDVEVFFDGVPGEENPFEALHAEQRDPWHVHESFYERRKRALSLAVLPHERYDNVLELGCSVGALAADLSRRSHSVIAVDQSLSALRLAADTLSDCPDVHLAHVQVPEELGPITADLVVISEIGYFLSPMRMSRLVEQVAASGARTVLACHWRHNIRGWPMDGFEVHHMLADRLGRPSVSIKDPDFLLDIFTVNQGTLR